MLLLGLVVWAMLSHPALASPVNGNRQVFAAYEPAGQLPNLALQKVLEDASPIFGPYRNNESPASTWMKKYPDSTLMVQMNIPGTHDTQTWNYSLATQQALTSVTNLGGTIAAPPQFYRCQEQSIIIMLNAGIRAFDLRFAADVTNTSLVFWHSQALQSQTATVQDVLFGFYMWLDEHPSEALLISLNYEGSTTRFGSNSAAVQTAIFDTLTSVAARKYFLQTKNELGTLGEARGKIVLLRRFNLDLLPASYADAVPGVYFPASQWTDNGRDISLVFNPAKNLTAYIEDYYSIDAPPGAGPVVNIDYKFNATTAHLLKASTQSPDALFWTFASSENNIDVPQQWPRIMALGDGANTPLGGVNQRLLSWLPEQKGKRLGIVMFDFFDTPSNLVETFLAL